VNPYLRITMAENDTPEHRALALKMAQESLVLLKNDGLLPLNRSKVKKIAVFGENATNQRMLYGNYNGTPSSAVTILQGLQEMAGTNIQVTYAQGCPLIVRTNNAGGGGGRGGFGGQQPTASRPLPELKAEAMSNAANADILIYVGGINSQLEGEEGNARGGGGADGFANGDRTRIELPQVQEDFLHTLAATGKPVIFINCSGSAMAIPWEARNIKAILQAWYPGEEGGRAVGQVIFGEVNPSGRLPITFYESTTNLPAFTNYSMANRTYRYFTGKPLYAFGHGLSYTKFSYAKAALSTKNLKADETVTITFNVRNSGKRDGDEVSQVYFRHVNSKVAQPIEALCGFARVHVASGQTSQVAISVPAERLRYWDTDKKQYTVEPGKYEFLIGAASDDIRLKVPMTVVAP
jgi:beta-glucosidase